MLGVNILILGFVNQPGVTSIIYIVINLLKNIFRTSYIVTPVIYIVVALSWENNLTSYLVTPDLALRQCLHVAFRVLPSRRGLH